MPALAAVLVVVTLVTCTVGVLGFVRIRKDRPSLKQYESSVSGESMGLDSARTTASKTDAETASLDTTESHMRARDQDSEEASGEHGDRASLLQRLGAMLWQLTGIPLLTGFITPRDTTADTDNAAMGNTAAPTRTLLSGVPALQSPTATKSASAEVDAVRDRKATALTQAVDNQVVWSDDERSGIESSEEEGDTEAEADDEETASQQTDEEKFEELRAHIMLDGLQFYTAVASMSVASVSHAVNIALFRATAIVLRERRKAHEDASIHAIETLYPDIMCLPPNANVRYAGPIKSTETAHHATRATAMSPSASKMQRQLETGFLKAA